MVNNLESSDYSGNKYSIRVGGNITNPEHKFKSNYNNGAGFKIGIGLEEQNNMGIGSGIFLEYLGDFIKLKENVLYPSSIKYKRDTKIFGGYLNARYNFFSLSTYKRPFFSLFSSTSLGYAKFSLNKDAFSELDNTKTELENKNNKTLPAYHHDIGLAGYISPLIQLEYSFEILSCDVNYKWTHSYISQTLCFGTRRLFEKLALNLILENKMTYGVISLIIGQAVFYTWVYFDYERHNWPWHDPSPLRYHRHSISITLKL